MQFPNFNPYSIRVLTLILWLTFAVHLSAREYLVQIRHFSIEDGLSHRDVQSVYQDRQNMIWLGTKYGLNRFDGLNFKWYTKETSGLQANDITNIIEGADGRMWLISTEHHSFGAIKNIDIFDPVREKAEPFEQVFGKTAPFAPKDVLSFCRNAAGHLLFLTQYSELIIYDGSFKTMPLCIEVAKKGMTLSSSPSGLIWLVLNIPFTGSPEDGGSTTIYAFNEKGEELRRFKHEDYDFSAIIDMDAFGNCKYIIAQSGKANQFYKIMPDGRRTKDPETEQLFTGYSLNTRSWDYYNNVLKAHNFWWVSTGDNKGGAGFMGIPSNNSNTLVTGNKFDGITYVNDIFQDRSGRLWLGTQFGFYLITLKPNHFSKLLYTEGNDRMAMRAIVQDDAENLWVVQDNRFNFWKIDGRTGKAAMVNHSEEIQDKLPVGNYFIALFKDSKGFLYYQSENQIVQFNPVTLEYELFKISDPDTKWMFYRVWTFYEDEFGKIWFSIDSGEIGFLENKKIVMLPPLEKLNGAVSFAYQFFKDRTGNTWLVSDGGLYGLEVQTGKIFERYWSGGKNQYYFPFDNLLYMYQDPDGSFWIGTSGSGLIHWNKGKPLNRQHTFTNGQNSYSPASGFYEQFTTVHGLSNNVVYAVYDDNCDNLWLPSDYGIMRFNKNTTRTETFLTGDGITHNEFNRVSHFKAKDGTLYFGGLNGITFFHPDRFSETESEINPPLVITDYQQFTEDGEISETRKSAFLRDKTITLLPDDRFFRLEFMLLNYEETSKNRYAYLLNGVDRQWHFIKDNVVNFSSVPYGKHRLQIKGQTPDGQWSDNLLTLQVVAVKPVYLQIWFLLLSLFMLGLASYLYYRRRTQLLRKRKQELEKIVEERTHQILVDKVTIEQQAKELKLLERQKSRFFANVSHELRTPLSLIIGPVATLLKSKVLEFQDRQLLNFVYQNGKQLLRLVNEILDLSKLEMGFLEVKESAINFHEFINSLVAQFGTIHHGKSIEVGLENLSDPQLNILTDVGMLEKVILNFLSNAVKFTDQGGTIILRVEDIGEQLMVVVSDNGTGIHPEDLPFIFERYFQSKLKNAPTQGGSGIGLSLCKELALLMGGTVWVESEWGRGSTFYFQFPKNEAPADLVVSSTTNELDNVLTNNSMNGNLQLPEGNNPSIAVKPVILITEDNNDLRNYLNILLSDQYEVISATNGQEACEILMSGRIPDLILSDIMMPVMDGFQLLDKIKSNDNFRHIPIIMLTAREDLKSKLKALRIGVDDYLTKPFEEEELKVRIKNLLDNYNNRLEFAKSPSNKNSQKPEEKQMIISSVDALWLEEVEKVFTQYLAEPQFDMDWAADKLNLSQRQFNRRIKQLTGLAPYQYLREMRLQTAKVFLDQGKFSTIKEVGYAVGYSDIKYFSAQFKERFGIYPSASLHSSIHH
ncbi:MAG: response regulator [Sphingobacteriales bacterium]|nr:MAG: response regulator [Sphingobacteriales bacterium]